MKQRYNFSIDEIENITPFERDLYIDIYNSIEKENQQRASGDGGYSQMLNERTNGR